MTIGRRTYLYRHHTTSWAFYINPVEPWRTHWKLYQAHMKTRGNFHVNSQNPELMRFMDGHTGAMWTLYIYICIPCHPHGAYRWHGCPTCSLHCIFPSCCLSCLALHVHLRSAYHFSLRIAYHFRVRFVSIFFLPISFLFVVIAIPLRAVISTFVFLRRVLVFDHRMLLLGIMCMVVSVVIYCSLLHS